MGIDELLFEGQRCLNLGNPKQALNYFSKILSAEPNHQKALVKSGNIFGKLGKYSQAISFYDKALETDPNDILALINKGLSFHFLKRYHEAIIFYDRVLEIKPNHSLALYNKASSLVQKGNVKEGLKILKNLILIDYSFKSKIRYDIDFQEIKNLTEFKKLIL